MNKLAIPLHTLIEHYTVDLRSQNKSSKTIDWYRANLIAFESWLKRHRHSALLEGIDIDVVRHYILYLQNRHRKFDGRTPTHQPGMSLSLTTPCRGMSEL